MVGWQEKYRAHKNHVLVIVMGSFPELLEEIREKWPP